MKTSPFAQKLFFNAIDLRYYLLCNPQLPFSSLISFLIDKIVFKKIKENTGGRLKYAVSGGAPISEATQKFLSSCVCPVLQGYGMTETTAVSCLLLPDHFALNTVGAPSPCVDIKLVDVPEMKYLTTNAKPQGEIWIRGSTICQGYYKRPELSSELITPEGWLKTGDIGEWNDNGTLRIIDRVKNLVKLAHGEYIALEKMESIYKGSKYLLNMFVFADSYKEYATAVVSCAHPVSPWSLHRHPRKLI
jgi:long-chain acyl-CoA synthetase